MILSSTDPPENTSMNVKLTKGNTSAVVQNSFVTFSCTSKASPPPHEHRFYHNDNLLGTNSSETYKTQVSESGLYSCVPVNTVGFGVSDTVNITVVGKIDIHVFNTAST